MYRTSLTTLTTTTTTTTLGGEGGGSNAVAKSRKNKQCKAWEEDFINGISWPPKSYGCSFCKREFRSAQALGGHMNVHRKDRALLYSPLPDPHFTNLNLNLNPNPNPNPNLSSRDDVATFGRRPFDQKASEFMNSLSRKEIAKPNVIEKVIGIFKSSTNYTSNTVVTDSKKDIDLELRLGYSST